MKAFFRRVVCFSGIVAALALQAEPKPKHLEWFAAEPELGGGHEEPYADLAFTLRNTGPSDIVIKTILPSCGCTALKVPAFPWTLAPGESGTVSARVDLRGKVGELHKRVLVYTTDNMLAMPFVVKIPEAPMSEGRLRNQQLALADSRAIFHGDCMKCHVEPAAGKTGAALFEGACAICHEAHPRASIVPELTANTRDHYRQWITHGRKGTLMPPFAREHGGILTREQIDSLVEYLATKDW